MITGNICITGATGFIGRNLLKSLQIFDNLSITAIVRTRESGEMIKDLDTECYIDDGDTVRLVNFFIEHKFDTVVHLASLYLKEHQSHQIGNLITSNVLFGTRLLEASIKSGVKFFINTGTFWQHYENRAYSPANLYAATKQSFEIIAQYYREISEIFFTTIYLNDTYGPGDTRKKILNIWNLLKDNDELDMSPGEQIINLLHIKDVIRGYIRLIDILQSSDLLKDSNISYVLKSKEEITLKQLAVLFERIAGKKLHINWGKREYMDRELMTPWSGGLTVPGWEPVVSLEEGLREFIFQCK